jgi:hypothetical protein
VVIWYAAEQADQGSLAEIAAYFGEPSRGDHLILAPFSYADEGEAGRLPAGTSRALVAWHRMQSCERLSLAVAEAFVASFRADPAHLENYRGVAPEAGIPI